MPTHFPHAVDLAGRLEVLVQCLTGVGDQFVVFLVEDRLQQLFAFGEPRSRRIRPSTRSAAECRGCTASSRRSSGSAASGRSGRPWPRLLPKPLGSDSGGRRSFEGRQPVLQRDGPAVPAAAYISSICRCQS